jgi:hypothetical protein
MKKIWIYTFVSILLLPIVLSLALSGDGLKIQFDFEPNTEKVFNYRFYHSKPYKANYKLFLQKHSGSAKYEEFIEIIPSEFTGVNPQTSTEFKVKFSFPEDTEASGNSEYRVWVKEIIESGGVLKAVPAVGVRFIIFALYPYKFLRVGISTSNINVGEPTTIKIGIKNLGKPTINNVYSDVEIIDFNNTVLATLKTNSISDLISRESSSLEATYDSSKMLAGDYWVKANVHWDGNTSIAQAKFRVGELKVLLHEFTKEFKLEAINLMKITVESKFNSPISDLYADVFISDIEGNIVRRFKTFDVNLPPWHQLDLQGYFDTSGLEAGTYSARVVLNYHGVTTERTEEIQIMDSAKTEVVEEIPEQKNFSLKAAFSSPFLIIFILIITAVVNIYLLMKKKKAGSFDDGLEQNVRNLLKTHSRPKLKKLLLKKGWPEKTIDEIFKKIK